MGMLSNRAANSITTAKAANKAPKEKFLLGSSECYFEPANTYAGTLNPTKIQNMFLNRIDVSAMAGIESAEVRLQESQGKSLKLTLILNHSSEVEGGEPVAEIQHVGFVTHSDYSIELDADDVPVILQHVQDEPIIQRTAVTDVTAMFG